MRRKNDLRTFKVYYFKGDFWSGKGEERGCTIIKALDEDEAERIFKLSYPGLSFGWVDIYKSRNGKNDISIKRSKEI